MGLDADLAMNDRHPELFPVVAHHFVGRRNDENAVPPGDAPKRAEQLTPEASTGKAWPG